MSTTPRLNAAQPIVNEERRMEQPFRTWTQLASLSIPIIGTGSPEGVVEAPQYQLYIDSSGSAGSIEYRKMLPDIGGDRKQGWIQV